MYRTIFLIPLLILGLSCARRGIERVEEEIPIDTLFITEIPAEVETVYVTETVVETVRAAEEISVTEMSAPMRMPGTFKVQIGAFENKGYADNLYGLLKGEYGEIIYIENIPPYWKIRLGPYRDFQKARSMRDKMREKGYSDAWVVPF